MDANADSCFPQDNQSQGCLELSMLIWWSLIMICAQSICRRRRVICQVRSMQWFVTAKQRLESWHVRQSLTSEDTWQLYVESIIILGLSIASCAAVVLAILVRFTRGAKTAKAADSTRDRHIRNTWESMVLILMVLELFQTFNWLAGTVISHYLFDLDHGKNDRSMCSLLYTVCKHIGASTYFFDLLLYSWNACMAYSMHSWVVRGMLIRHLRMQAAASLVLLVFMSALLTLVPALREELGALPEVVCWLRTLDFTSFSVILNKLVILPACWIITGYCYAHTIVHLRRHSHDTPLPVAYAYGRLRTRVILLASIFFFAWLLNSIWYTFVSFKIVNMPLAIIGKCYHAVGLLDSLVYGYSTRTTSTGHLAESRSMEGGTAGRGGNVSSTEFPAQLDLPLQRNTCRLFVTTLNCGRCLSPMDLGSLAEWVPLYGYDIYVFGFQECRMLNGLRRTIGEHLGRSDQFVLFEQVLGDGTMWNGQIALLVFARADDVARGVFKIADGGRGSITHGVNLGFGRYHNKGATGLAFQIHGASVAFITAHFASDSAGRQRLERRNEDALRTLHTLRLGAEMEDFDLHHQHHHVIILGDLNYRNNAFCEEVLSKIAAACEVERQQSRLPRSSGWHCRRASYSVFFAEPSRTQSGGKGSKSTCRTDRSSVLPAVSEAMHWEWVKGVDQLSLAMAEGLVFAGFREGPVRFPPSFKMHPNTVIEDYADVEDLRYGYQLSKRTAYYVYRDTDGDWRPPSWTDRILYHSLPALQDHLILEAYDFCDRITGSDHRPVSASFRMVFMPVIAQGGSCKFPSRTCSEQLSRGGGSSQEGSVQEPTEQLKEAGQSAYGGGDWGQPGRRRDDDSSLPVECSGLTQHLEVDPSRCRGSRQSFVGPVMAVPPVRTELLHVKMTNFVLAMLNKEFLLSATSPASTALLGMVGDGAAEEVASITLSSISSATQGRVGGLSSRVNPGTSLDRSASGSSRYRSCGDAVHEVVILLPTPVGDSLGTYRRVASLEGIQGAPARGQDSSEQASFSTTNLHRFAWADAGGACGLWFATTVQNVLGSHAIIKFVNRHGVNLGEGVFALHEASEFSTESMVLVYGHATVRQVAACGRGLEHGRISTSVCGQQISVQLSVGGVLCGQVSFSLIVTCPAISDL